MDKTIQGGLSIAVLFWAGQCVADLPTGAELFDLQQQQKNIVAVPVGDGAAPSGITGLDDRTPSIWLHDVESA